MVALVIHPHRSRPMLRPLLALYALAYVALSLYRMDAYIPTPAQVAQVNHSVVVAVLLTLALCVEGSYRKVGGLTFWRVGRLWGSWGISRA